MDANRPSSAWRALLLPALVVLAVPAIILAAGFAVLRAVWLGLGQMLAMLLPWRRVEMGTPKAIRAPHFTDIPGRIGDPKSSQPAE